MILGLITDTYTIIITMKMMMRVMTAPVANPPMNEPLTTAGEKKLFNLVASDCRELLQLVQSTATTPTSIPSTIKEKGTWLVSLLMMIEAVSEPSLFEYSMVDVYVSLPLSSQSVLESMKSSLLKLQRHSVLIFENSACSINSCIIIKNSRHNFRMQITKVNLRLNCHKLFQIGYQTQSPS